MAGAGGVDSLEDQLRVLCATVSPEDSIASINTLIKIVQ